MSNFKVFVGNLDYSINESTLTDLFTPFGDVEHVAIIKDRDTGLPKGFGFVNMCSEAALIESIGTLNGRDVAGRKLRVCKANDKPEGVVSGRVFESSYNGGTKLYVGNLPYDTTEEDVAAVFSEVGPVVSVKINTDANGTSKGFAFVEMVDASGAKLAIEKLNNTNLGGRSINVNSAREKVRK